MRKYAAAILCFGLCLAGCGPKESAQSAAPGRGTNSFNPYLHERLPNVRASAADEQMLQQMGMQVQRIEGEAAYRQHWPNELYPVVFGDLRAPHEILVLLDFAAPQSEKIWKAMTEASRSLSPAQTKIVVLANSRENYGTDLMGLAIWISYARSGQTMPYLSHALSRWNMIKAEQKRVKGHAVPFTNEYDAVANTTDYPIHYEYMAKVRPPVPTKDELTVAKYCYDAGNVNLYQAVQISLYYGVKSLPAVIVDGKVLETVSADTVANALKQP